MIDFKKIRELRENQEWSQEETAERLNMSKNGYAEIERGESLPSLKRLEQIANLFNISIIELLKLEDKNIYIQSQNCQNNQSNYFYNENQQALLSEIEKLNLIIQHQKEIIKQKDDYIRLLKRLANISEDELIIL